MPLNKESISKLSTTCDTRIKAAYIKVFANFLSFKENAKSKEDIQTRKKDPKKPVKPSIIPSNNYNSLLLSLTENSEDKNFKILHSRNNFEIFWKI